MSIFSKASSDARFIAFWVCVWMPVTCTAYIALASCSPPATLLKAWIGWMGFVYALFAPALWHVFFQARTSEPPATRGEGR
jgi:hypothetical protein